MNNLVPKPPFIQTIESLALPFKLYFDWEVPFQAKFFPTLIFLLYLVFPLDFITDYIPAIGLVDDAAVFSGCAYLLVRLTPPQILAKYYPSENTNQPAEKKKIKVEKVIEVKKSSKES